MTNFPKKLRKFKIFKNSQYSIQEKYFILKYTTQQKYFIFKKFLMNNYK